MSDKLIAGLLAIGLIIGERFAPGLLGDQKDLIIPLVAYWFGKTLGVVNGSPSGKGLV
jgi:hypothetical protein